MKVNSKNLKYLEYLKDKKLYRIKNKSGYHSIQLFISGC